MGDEQRRWNVEDGFDVNSPRIFEPRADTDELRELLRDLADDFEAYAGKVDAEASGYYRLAREALKRVASEPQTTRKDA